MTEIKWLIDDKRVFFPGPPQLLSSFFPLLAQSNCKLIDVEERLKFRGVKLV